MVVALTIDTRTETTWRIDNARSYPTKPPADHSRGTSGPLAHVRVFAGRRAAVDPAATLSLRTGCDATLQSVYPGRSACLSLHVCLPALSQPHLPRRIVRRPEKEAETPLRNPIIPGSRQRRQPATRRFRESLGKAVIMACWRARCCTRCRTQTPSTYAK